MGEKYYLGAQQRPRNYPNCRCEIVKRQNNYTVKKTMKSYKVIARTCPRFIDHLPADYHGGFAVCINRTVR